MLRKISLSLVLSVAACSNGTNSASRQPKDDGGGSTDSSGGAPSGTGGTRSGTGGTRSGTGGNAGSTAGGDSGADARTDAASRDASPGSVTLTTYVGFAQSNLVFVAGQDGDGPWTVLRGGGGKYALSLSTARYSFVIVCPPYRVETLHFTVSEWPDPAAACSDPGAGHAVSGSVGGLGAGERARVNLGNGLVNATASAPGYAMTVQDGTWDAVVTRSDTNSTTQVIIERDVNVFDVLTKGFDFKTQGFAPVSHSLGVTGALAAGEVLSTGVNFLSHRGTFAFLSSPPGTALFVPESELSPNEVHRVGAFAIDDSSGTQRAAAASRRLPGDVTLTLPPAFDADVSVAATSPQVRFGFSFDVAPGANEFQAGFFQGGLAWLGRISPGWLGSTSRGTYTFPDFSALPGWVATYGLTVGVKTQYEISAESSNRGIADGLARAITAPGLDGLVTSSAQKSGEIIP